MCINSHAQVEATRAAIERVSQGWKQRDRRKRYLLADCCNALGGNANFSNFKTEPKARKNPHPEKLQPKTRKKNLQLNKIISIEEKQSKHLFLKYTELTEPGSNH